MTTIHQYTEADKNYWDTYVHNHPHATLYHLSGWKNVIEKTYGHKTYYLMATKEKLRSREAERLGSKNQLKVEGRIKIQPTTNNLSNEIYFNNSDSEFHRDQQLTPAELAGLLPLVHIKHFLFGSSLISTPFFDMGGILADDEETEKALLTEAINLAKNIGANSIELRQINPINSLESQIQNSEFRIKNLSTATHSHKVRMLLKLPESSETLMKSFKSKLRSQIKKPMKGGLKAKIGGAELINDFYKVFTINMRDLGSPVHSKTLFRNVLQKFQENTKIVILYKGHVPAACSLIIGFKDTLENPWASSLREFSRLAPNMLLYWTMLEYACNNGFKFFDFGRSTPGEGTYRFKEQWGAIPERLHWQYVSFAKEHFENGKSSKDKYSKFVLLWKNLPVPITKIIGPPIRKYIGL